MSQFSLLEFIQQGLDGLQSVAQRGRDAYNAQLDHHSKAELDVSRSGRSLPEGIKGRPEFKAAREVWYTVMVPQLRRLELERAKAKRNFIQRAVPVGIGALIAVFLIARLFPAIALLVFGGVFVFMSFTKSHRQRLAEIGYEAKRLIVGSACELFGFKFQPLPIEPPALFSFLRKPQKGHKVCPTPAFDVLNRYGLLPSYTSATFEDGVTGMRAGAEFSIVEANLREQQGKSTPTVFQGILIHIAYPERFLGQTVICRRSEMRRLRKHKALQPVDIVASEFESDFLVFSNDQVEARALLTPDRLMRLITLERYFLSGKLRAVFEDGHMTIAIHAKDMFEVGNAWNSLVDESRFADCLHELGLICDVLDGYLTREWAARRAG